MIRLLAALLALLFIQSSAHAQDMQFRIQPFAVARTASGQVTPQLDLLAAFGSTKRKWLGASSYTYLSEGYALSYAGPEFYPASWALISTYLGMEQGPTLAESWRAATFLGLYGKPVSFTALIETGGTGPWIGSDLRFDVKPQHFWFTASYRRFVGLGARVYVGLVLDHERTFAFWAGYAPWDPEHPSQRKTDQILFGMYALLKSPAPGANAVAPQARPLRAELSEPPAREANAVVMPVTAAAVQAAPADSKAPPVDPASMGPAPDPFANTKTTEEASSEEAAADIEPASETPQTGLAPFAPPSQGQPVLR